MVRPHLLVISFPAQGHIMPLMEFSHNLVERGFRITFVNTEFIHKRVVAAPSNKGHHMDFIELVSIPDGFEVGGNEFVDYVKMLETMLTKLPGHLEELIKRINQSSNGDDKISCVIADGHMAWALEVAEKMSIRRAVVWPASATLMALTLHIPNLIEDGIITSDGYPIKDQMVQISPTIPDINTAYFSWFCMHVPVLKELMFKLLVHNNSSLKLADHFLCNSFYDLEPSAFSLIPNLKPIGPIFACSRLGHLWPEDLTCLSWLDQQQTGSVIYVSFGSGTILDRKQVDELALGFELCGKPFLWVVRQGLVPGEVTAVYPDGFEERVGSRGRMVSWAPQREVLAHPSVGCFLTHCGWNSTIEAITHGVPLLCWPFAYDQFINERYICDVWKNGMGLELDENGYRSREEIKTKVVALFGDADIKASALGLKEAAVNNVNFGGNSLKNFEEFVQAIK
nr:glycosyltransferase [Helleborus thibetanus]